MRARLHPRCRRQRQPTKSLPSIEGSLLCVRMRNGEENRVHRPRQSQKVGTVIRLGSRKAYRRSPVVHSESGCDLFPEDICILCTPSDLSESFGYSNLCAIARPADSNARWPTLQAQAQFPALHSLD